MNSITRETVNTAGKMSGEKPSFSDFYSEIRRYFSSCIVEYDRFKEAETVDGRLGYLMKNDVVINALARLEDQNLVPKRKPQGEKKKKMARAAVINDQPKAMFPQMSKKLSLTTTKKSGRCIVAKQKILPGNEQVCSRYLFCRMPLNMCFPSGELLILEEAYTTMTYPEFRTSHCLHCFANLEAIPIEVPCTDCRQVRIVVNVPLNSNL